MDNQAIQSHKRSSILWSVDRRQNVESEQFWHAFASRGFVSDSWAFLYLVVST